MRETQTGMGRRQEKGKKRRETKRQEMRNRRAVAGDTDWNGREAREGKEEKRHNETRDAGSVSS